MLRNEIITMVNGWMNQRCRTNNAKWKLISKTLIHTVDEHINRLRWKSNKLDFAWGETKANSLFLSPLHIKLSLDKSMQLAVIKYSKYEQINQLKWIAFSTHLSSFFTLIYLSFILNIRLKFICYFDAKHFHLHWVVYFILSQTVIGTDSEHYYSNKKCERMKNLSIKKQSSLLIKFINLLSSPNMTTDSKSSQTVKILLTIWKLFARWMTATKIESKQPRW